MKNIGITIYGCEKDEEDMFNRLSPDFGVMPTVVSAPISESNAYISPGNRCISVSHKFEVSEAILLALKDARVKYISTRSVGYDHINTRAAKNLGITVECADYSPDSVADYTLMLMLMALRNAKSLVNSVRQNDFRLGSIRGNTMRNMSVGVLGTGRIGKALIERLRGFGCHTLAYDRNWDAAVEYVTLVELLQKSDIITLHLPLNADTQHIIGREQLENIKQGAFIINTGRGALIDTDALVNALESGNLGGAALDVLEGEDGIFYFDRRQKPLDNQLLLRLQNMPNVIITPHTAYYTEQALFETVEKTIKNCLHFCKGEYQYE